MWETEPAAAGLSSGGDDAGIVDSAVLAELAGCDIAAYLARRPMTEEPRRPLNLTMGHFGFNE